MGLRGAAAQAQLGSVRVVAAADNPGTWNSPAFTAFLAHAATAERRETGRQAIAAALPTALLLGRRRLLVLHGRLALGRAVILTLRGTILALGRTVLALRGTVGLRGKKSQRRCDEMVVFVVGPLTGLGC